MKERPILFNGDMVRAIREGRKTQTRRIVKNQPEGHHWEGFKSYKLEPHKAAPGLNVWSFKHSFKEGALGAKEHELSFSCPYGEPGDQLWVRETHYQWGRWVKNGFSEKGRQKYTFKPKGQKVTFPDILDSDHPHIRHKGTRLLVGWHKRPSIFLPRWAARIHLEVVGVRVERLNQISEDDARAEGAKYHDGRGIGHSGWRYDFGDVFKTAKQAFYHLWNSINLARGYGWESNPWVWVVEFKRVERVGE